MSETTQQLDEKQNKIVAGNTDSMKLEAPEISPIHTVVRMEGPNGVKKEIICTGEEEELDNGVVKTEGVLISDITGGFLDGPTPAAERGKARKAVALGTAGVMGLGSLFAAVAGNGCGFDNSEGKAAVNQMKQGLTSTDYTHGFTDELAPCFYQSGDGFRNRGELPNGDVIVTFVRNVGGYDKCFGVTASDYQTARTQECTAQQIDIPGIFVPSPNTPINSCTADGTEMVASRGSEVIYGNVTVDGSGVISFSNPQWVPEIQGAVAVSFTRDGGQRFLMNDQGGYVNKIDINGVIPTENTTIPDDCGLPAKDEQANLWVGSKMDGGTCKVYFATTLAGINTSLDQIFNGENPRPGNVYILVKQSTNGNTDYTVVEYCGDGACNNGENQTSCSVDCGTAPVCGDGNVDTGEVCDDNNTVDGDGCSANCQSDETCGNGVTDTVTGEVCDDNNNTDGDGCAADCLSDETCGNNVVDPGEDCDDGNTVSGDGCEADCTDPVPPVCGDATCEPPETNATCPEDCDPGPVCGDGTCETPETNATCPADCDVIPPECEQVLENVEWTSGQCTLSECDGGAKIAKFEGPCSFDLTLQGGGTVSVTVEGEARVDAINNLGEPINYGDSIDFTTNGNTFNGKVENGVTGVSGTRALVVKVQIPETENTGITVRLLEDSSGVLIDGELMDTLIAGTDNFEGTWDLTTKERVQNTIIPDAGVDGGTGADAGTGDKPGEKCGGCTSSGESNLPAPATILLAGIVAMALRRKKKQVEVIETEVPADEGSGLEVPGPGLYSYFRERLNGALDRIRK